MDLKNKLPLLLVVVLMGLAFFGVLEESAFEFVKGVYHKNLNFLELITEIKLVLGGIGSSQVPFVEGMATNVNTDMGKVQRFLLITNMISFLQIIIIAISKSWILKVGTGILFVLSFVPKTKIIGTKLLLFSLALNPGLVLYSTAVHQISKEASIDYGDKYLKKLKIEVKAIKSEKTELMKQHAADITKIKNGHKGFQILRRFRENVTYDFKRAKEDIKGERANIRILLHKGGYEIISKIYSFCSMILFNMLLLPLGYALLIYTLFKSFFRSNHHVVLGDTSPIKLTEKNTSKSNFTSKVKSVFKTYLEEFHSIPKSVENPKLYQKEKEKIKKIEDRVVTKVKNEVNEEVDQLKSKVEKVETTIDSKTKDVVESETGHIKSRITEETNKIGGEATKKMHETENEVVKNIDRVKTEVKSTVSEVSNKQKSNSQEEDDTSSNTLSI